MLVEVGLLLAGLGIAGDAESAPPPTSPEIEGEGEESVRNESSNSLFSAKGGDRMEDELRGSCDR